MNVRTLGRDVSAPLSTNLHLLRWVRKMADLARPKSIHWVDGSAEEYDLLCEEMVQNGTLPTTTAWAVTFPIRWSAGPRSGRR